MTETESLVCEPRSCNRRGSLRRCLTPTSSLTPTSCLLTRPSFVAAQPKVVLVCTSANDLQGHKTGLWIEELAAPYYGTK